MPDALPICPHCETTRGALGDPCPEAACARRGYRLIPHGWFATARDAAARRNKPLDPLIGRSLDRYLLAGKIGEGGMGAVYVALQRPLMREVAIKVVSGLELTESTVARFEREARAVATLDHPNIVKLHDYGVGELEAPAGQGPDAPVRVRMPYMALEYLRNARSIRRVLTQAREEGGGNLSAAVVLTVFEQVLNALTAAHAAGIVHRDVKPDNVMVVSVPGNRFHVKVLDFGLAKVVSEVSGGGDDGEITRTGQLLGTPFYMAPEQAPGPSRGEVDARTDLYAVAVMLYEVFTGVRPFQGDSALEVISLKIDPDYRPLDRPEARGLPRGLKSFLAKGLACRPGDRFASADEMAAALRHAVSGRVTTAIGLAAGGGGSSEDPSIAYPSLGGTPVPASPGAPPTSPASPATLREDEPRVPRVPRVAIAVAVAIVGVALGAGAWLFLAPSPAPEPPAPDAMPVAAVPQDVAASADAAPAEPGPQPRVEAVRPPSAEVRVQVRSRPPGAAVRIDGLEAGKAPLDHVFEGGDPDRVVEFSASLPGFSPAAKRAKLSEAARQGVDLVLRKKGWTPPL